MERCGCPAFRRKRKKSKNYVGGGGGGRGGDGKRTEKRNWRLGLISFFLTWGGRTHPSDWENEPHKSVDLNKQR